MQRVGATLCGPPSRLVHLPSFDPEGTAFERRGKDDATGDPSLLQGKGQGCEHTTLLSEFSIPDTVRVETLYVSHFLAENPIARSGNFLQKFFNFINSPGIRRIEKFYKFFKFPMRATRIRKFEEFKILQIFPDTLRV
jgi:hypothetical protein